MLRLKTKTKKYKTVNKLITKALIATIYCYAFGFLKHKQNEKYRCRKY